MNKSEIWWITGANGSEKTTLPEVITGEQRFAGGEMILPGDMPVEKFLSAVSIIKRDFSLYHLFSKSASFYQRMKFLR